MVNYSALTDRRAVEDALNEFDSEGRDSFLHTYGFGPAVEYFLVTDEGRYDSKAIFAVAWRNEHGEALDSTSLSGGKTGAAKRLSELGFEIEGLELKAGRRYFDSFDEALGEYPLPMENRPAVSEFLRDRHYERFYIPGSGAYIAALPRERKTADFFHRGYIWFRDENGDGHMHWLPVNGGARGFSNRRRSERPSAVCPDCMMERPLSGVCNSC